jgi:protein tyrosine/serine phosphatase
MTESDLATLKDLGVKSQIDLRKNDEITDQGRGPLPGMGAHYHHLPVIPDDGSDELARLVGDTGISGARYLGYLHFGPDTWLNLCDVFANAEHHPIVIHCTAGKDRTGVSTAFLLSILGVSREVIEADYLLTNRDVPRQVDYLEKNGLLPEGIDAVTMAHHAGVPETAMKDFIDGLEEKYGGALSYLESIGVADSTFDSIRSHFLEPKV